MLTTTTMDQEHITSCGEGSRPHLAATTNNHWDTLFEGDMVTEEPDPRRPPPQVISNHWGTTIFEGDLAAETNQAATPRPRHQATNSHWDALLEGDLDVDATNTSPYRPRAQVVNSHWDTLSEDDIDGQNSKPRRPANQHTEAPGTEKKTKKEKVKRYSLNKPNFSEGLPLSFQVKYRPPENVARIVIPDCADHTLVRVGRPGATRLARPKSPLSEVTNADDI